jgi:hypothetical protein
MTDVDGKGATDRVSDDIVKNPSLEPGHGVPRSKLQPPALVAAMTKEERDVAEAKMRRKIDLRLMPMVILMYVMNYLGKLHRHSSPILALCR